MSRLAFEQDQHTRRNGEQLKNDLAGREADPQQRQHTRWVKKPRPDQARSTRRRDSSRGRYHPAPPDNTPAHRD